MKTVAFISNSLVGAGAERIVARLLSTPVPLAPDTRRHLILLDEDEIAYPIPASVPVHCLDSKGSLLKGAIRLNAKLRELRPDICVSFGTRSNLLAASVARRTGARVVISERVNTSSHHPNSLGGRVAKLLTRMLYRHAHHVIAVSRGVATDLSDNFGVPSRIISVIANPIDSEEVIALGAEPIAWQHLARPITVGMGRLVPNKNFSLLVEAFRLSGAPGTLVILGKGPLREQLLEQVEAAGLSGRVVLAGFQANPFALLAKADCFVLPSNGEGFPNGLVEAMILGVPVISTNCPSGPAEILDDQPDLEVVDLHEGRYGLLVPMNAPAVLARALKAVLSPGQRERRGQLAQLGAARYDMAGTLRTYWGVIFGDAQNSR